MTTMKKTLTLLFVGISFCMQAQVSKIIDSLTQESYRVKNPRQLFTIYDELVTQWAESDFDSSNLYANKLLAIATQIDEPKLKAQALLRKGTAHDYFSKFDSAIFYYQQSLRYSQTNHDSVGIASALFSLAIVAQLQGNNVEAIDQYLEVEKMFKSLGDDRRLSRLYNNLGSIYRKTEQFDAAIQVYENSLAIKKKLNDTRGILNTSINLALLYSFAGRYEEAISLYLKNLGEVRKSGDVLNEISILINLGMVYTKESNQVTKDLSRGLRYLIQAEQLLKESSPIGLKIECWANLAGAYQAIENHRATSDYLKKMEQVFDELSPEAKISYYELKSNEQLSRQNYKEAFFFFKKLTVEQNNLTSRKLKERAQELEVRYETEKKERQIVQLELAEQKAMTVQKQSAWQRNFLISVAGSLLLISLLIFYQYRLKQKSNALLTDKNQTIARSLHERETLLKEIHHRVKNNLQIISSLLSLQSKNTNDAATQGAISESRNRVKSMSLIHEQLYQEDTISGVEMMDYITRLVSSLSSSYGLDADRIKIEIVAENILLDVDSAIPLGLIINELVSNSMKYAFPDHRSGSILISLTDKINELVLVVQDDGVGMDTARNTSQSFGLSLVNSLMRKLKADMELVSRTDLPGSTFGTSVQLIIKDFKKITLA